MKKLVSVLLMIAMLLGAAACAETFVFTDDCGREVEVPKYAQRIVPSGPLSQIILYAIAPESMVGLASKYNAAADGIIPEDRQSLPYFGQLYNTANLSVEELALVGPELIIDIGRTVDSGKEDLDNLQDTTQIPSVFISASLETMPQTFRRLGELLGRQEKAEQLAAFCERVYGRTIAIMDKVGDQKVRAMYFLGMDGLSVLAKNSYHSELIDMLTDNLAVVENPSSKGSGNAVTMEQIALWNPDFILFAPDAIYDTVKDMDTWSEISAIQTDNYIKVPEGPHNWMGTPPAVQRYLGMIWLTAQLYPQYCDYDVKEEILEYYKLFYDCELTEQQYQNLTKDAFVKK